MLPRPAWLALGVVVAAGTASYEPFGGDSGTAVVAAVGLAVALAVAACAARAGGRRGLGSSLAAASLGASLVAARLAIGLIVGSGTATPESTSLPPGTGPWLATVESAHETSGQQIATIFVADAQVRCSAQMPVYPRLIGGDTVSWSGRIRALTDSDYDRFLAAQGIAASCEATELTVVSHDDSPAGRLEALRQASGDALQRVLPEPEGGLAAAILIGLRDRVDRGVAAAFTASGVSHIVAISGWNIAIVAAAVAALLRGQFSRRRRALVTILAIVGYTLFAGASASVIRAAVMAGVALAAVESGRGSRAMVGLSWAVAMMVVAEPATVGDVGFQLSAAATAGLVAWATPLTAWLAVRAPRIPDEPARESRRLARRPGGDAPDRAAHIRAAGGHRSGGQPRGRPARAADHGRRGNRFRGRLAGRGRSPELADRRCWPCPPRCCSPRSLPWCRRPRPFPGASQTLAFPANVAAAAGATGLLVLLHRAFPARRSPRSRARPTLPGPARTPGPRVPRHYRWAIAGAALLVVVAGSVVAAGPDGSVHVIVLDVGQGDSILLEGDRGGRVLVDGGPDTNVLMEDLDRYIPTWDRRLDAIVLTHPHDDHVTGLVGVVERYEVGRAFESGWSVDTPAYRAWESALSSKGLRPERLRTGETLRLDDATLSVLWPDDGTTRPACLDQAATDNRKTNDASIVLLGEYEGRRFLLTGDAEDDVDPILLSRGLPAVDMLKVAHHGSATASSEAFLAAVRPAVAVVSVGAKNPYGHPNAATMARLRAHSSRVARTDQEGTVETTLNRTAVTVTSSGAPAATGAPGLSSAAAAGSSGLLYDSPDVRPEPPRERGIASVARTSEMALPPLARRRGDGGMAGLARANGGSIARSPPRRGGRAAA